MHTASHLIFRHWLRSVRRRRCCALSSATANFSTQLSPLPAHCLQALVLCVDSDEAQSTTMARIVESAGLEFVGVSSARECMAALQKGSPSLGRLPNIILLAVDSPLDLSGAAWTDPSFCAVFMICSVFLGVVTVPTTAGSPPRAEPQRAIPGPQPWSCAVPPHLLPALCCSVYMYPHLC